MRLATTALLCLLMAGCAAPSPPSLARAAETSRQPELPATTAAFSASDCVVRSTNGGPVTDRNGTPVRC